MIEVRHPAPTFTDADGTPLDQGYIYVGPTGMNPETTAQSVYWDKAGLIPAAQPIRTVNGYPARDGAAAKFYTSTKNYSITVKDRRNVLVVSTLNNDSGIFDELATTVAMAGIGYDNTTSGLAATNGQAAIDELKVDVNEAAQSIADLSTSFPVLLNLVSNPAFIINQRNYATGTATVAPNQYTLDRWRVVVSGESLAFVAADYGLRVTAPAGGLEQVIEGVYIVGGDYACSWTGTGTLQVNGVFKEKGETFTLTANTNATITIRGEVEKIVLSRPEFVSRFEYDFGDDQRRCMRYYEKSTVALRANGYIGFVYAQQSFKVVKRIAPTMSFASTSYTSASGAGFNSATTFGAELFVTTSANNGFVTTDYFASAEL